MKPGSPRFKHGDYIQPRGIKNPEYLLKIVGIFNPTRALRDDQYYCQWVHPDLKLKQDVEWMDISYIDSNFELAPAALVILFGGT